MNRADKEREQQLNKLKLILVVAFVVCVIATICVLVAMLTYKKSDDEQNVEDYASSLLENDTRSDAKLTYGGDTSVFEQLNNVVTGYLNCFEKGQFSLMWEKWDESLLEYYGYSYDEESFAKEYQKLRKSLHADPKDSSHASTAYNAVTYFDYGQYYLFVFKWVHSYYDDAGKLVSTADEYTYTITKYENDGKTYYRLLDFNIQDVGAQSGRFTNKRATDKGYGKEVSPGIFLPSESSGTQQSTEK